MPRIVSSLHARPDTGIISEQLTEPNRDIRRYPLALVQNVVEARARNPGGTTLGRHVNRQTQELSTGKFHGDPI